MKKQLQHLTSTFFKANIVIALFFAVNSSFATTIVVDSINDAGVGSLRAAAAAASSGDTIRFNPNLLTAAVDSISLSNEIFFGSKSIVIKGLYTATDTLFISGANSSRIFTFNSGGKVVLDSLVLINGNSGSGAAVFHLGCTDTLHVLNSIIRNNTCSNGGWGGGIHSQSSSLGAIIIANSAK